MSSPSAQRLLQLFEQELRDLDTRPSDGGSKRAPLRISQDLDRQVVEYAAQVRTHGNTPEQMLVELKSMLSQVAPEVPTTQRNVLLAELTGRAINAFYGTQAATDKR